MQDIRFPYPSLIFIESNLNLNLYTMRVSEIFTFVPNSWLILGMSSSAIVVSTATTRFSATMANTGSVKVMIPSRQKPNCDIESPETRLRGFGTILFHLRIKCDWNMESNQKSSTFWSWQRIHQNKYWILKEIYNERCTYREKTARWYHYSKRYTKSSETNL